MLSRILVSCFVLFATGESVACGCATPSDMFEAWQVHGLSGRGEVFHGKVSRYFGPKEVDVQVIESFAGSGGTKHLIGAPGPADECGGEFSPGEEFIYLPTKENVIGYCSKLWVTPGTIERLRAIAKRSGK